MRERVVVAAGGVLGDPVRHSLRHMDAQARVQVGSWVGPATCSQLSAAAAA